MTATRVVMTLSMLAIVTAVGFLPASAQVAPLPDGLTAKIATLNGISNIVLRSDAAGNYSLMVWIFEETPIWSQVVRNATLILRSPPGLNDTVVIPFVSEPNGPVFFSIPNSSIAFAPGDHNAVDILVRVGARESHANAIANFAIDQKKYDVADVLDTVPASVEVAL